MLQVLLRCSAEVCKSLDTHVHAAEDAAAAVVSLSAGESGWAVYAAGCTCSALQPDTRSRRYVRASLCVHMFQTKLQHIGLSQPSSSHTLCLNNNTAPAEHAGVHAITAALMHQELIHCCCSCHTKHAQPAALQRAYACKHGQPPLKSAHLLSMLGMLAMTGPYLLKLSYSSNSGTATRL